jgi:osmotically-inducible protein OsmY
MSDERPRFGPISRGTLGGFGSTRHDAEIAQDVCRRLGEHGSLDAHEVNVEVKNGEVTLEGRVSDEPARHVAELIADAVPGVRGVVNRLDTTHG